MVIYIKFTHELTSIMLIYRFNRLFKSYMHNLMRNKQSIFARIYGVFSVKIEKLEKVHLIMMHNTIQSK